MKTIKKAEDKLKKLTKTSKEKAWQQFRIGRQSRGVKADEKSKEIHAKKN